MQIDPANLHTFNGGLRLPSHKALSTSLPIITAELPPLLTLPLSQHIGKAAEPVITVGEKVLKGQLIAKAKDYVSASVHAPSSGSIVAIEKRPVPHPSGMSDECIIIETDGKEQWRWRRDRIDDYTKLDPSELRNRLREAGIVGLGGAGFPTFVKMNPGPDRKIDLLIINGAECEPFITCDDMLMRDNPWEIVGGLQILRHSVQAKQCVIAIEEDMPLAYASMEIAIQALNDPTVQLAKIPPIYPSGGEKQLIKLLTGLEVPSQGLPADIGVICQNVGTAVAVCKAVTEREPLISRVVTVTGSGVQTPRNLMALIGTPMEQLIAQCGGYTDKATRLIMGGPLMGVALPNDRLPITKTTNCLLVAGNTDIPDKKTSIPCIRCGDCADVCPADLLPQQLYWHTYTKEFEKVKEFNLFDCIECGCCSYVCPSHIPLVEFYRYAKSEIWSQEVQREQSDLAGKRYDFRSDRLEQQKKERAERSARRRKEIQDNKQTSGNKAQNIIQAAVERVKNKKNEAGKS